MAEAVSLPQVGPIERPAPGLPARFLGFFVTLARRKPLGFACLVFLVFLIVLALAPGLTLDRMVYFGLASFGAMWVCLLSLAMLYVLRVPLERLRPVHIALVALVLLLLNTWLAAFTITQLLGSARRSISTRCACRPKTLSAARARVSASP